MLLALLFIGFNSCKKTETSTLTPTPSNYNFTVTNSQEAFVLVTTATWCKYCWDWGIPTFEDAFAGANSVDATKVNGLALHYSGSDPMFLQMAADIKTQYAIGGPPNLWVEFDNTYNLQPTGWTNAVKTRQSSTSACGVNLNKVLDGNTYKVYVKAKFFSTLTGTYNLAVYAIENGIVANQTTMTASDPNFVHNQVLRGEITNDSPWGKQIFSGTSATDYQYEYTYTPASGVNINQVSFVAVVYRMDAGKPVESLNSNTK